MSRLPMTSEILLKPTSVANANEAEWDQKKFFQNFQIKIIKMNETEMEFDLIGICASIANALRRILISESPSMAIEKVFIYNNTSIIQDEILAHRLGLIPLKADPSLFEYRDKENTNSSPQDTLEFELKIKCIKNPNNDGDSRIPKDLYVNNNVYSKHIKWIPIGGQAEIFDASNVGPIHDDILIAKMRPGHELDLKLHAVKGIGEDHAKFSPVATASYRLMPNIKLLKKFEGNEAILLQKCFSPGVIGVEEVDGEIRAKVLNSRYDNCSRNCYRFEDKKMSESIQITRVRDHFIFTIESIGAQTPDVLFIEAIKMLKQRCKTYIEDLNKN